MCGIVGYIGTRRVIPVLLEGLRRLEYRGYDSAGIVYLLDGRLQRTRSQGKLTRLASAVDESIGAPSGIGLGHTRWATHGPPTEDNAHPHTDCTGRVSVVHNGIIENHDSLRRELRGRGHVFRSATDTEVLAHLIEEHLDAGLEEAVRLALTRVEGSYALGVLCADRPDLLVAARRRSPLVIGVDQGGRYIASDIPALLPFTRNVIYLEDGEMALLGPDSHEIRDLGGGGPREHALEEITWNAAMAEKGGFRHFMAKEIHEQPDAIVSTLAGRLHAETGEVDLGREIGLDEEELRGLRRIVLVACGTSWHAALVARYWLERHARIPAEVEIASEFRYRDLVLGPGTLCVAVSQSGETADTLAGIRQAARLGARVLGICNVVGSAMTRESDGVLYTHAGPEISVASTKAFTSQLTALMLLTLYLARVRGCLDPASGAALGRGLAGIGPLMRDVALDLQARVREVAGGYHNRADFLFVGRGLNFPVALEGALKLKELSYIHAEGYAAGELKHGPIALIDQDMPVVGLLPDDSLYDKTRSNLEEIRTRGGRLILVGSEDDGKAGELSGDVLRLPRVHPELSPLLYSLPLQMLAYEIACRRGCDVDQPRNLAKCVTVE